jgi:formiminotetrahydrofolate cyclodeaminase
MVLNFTVGRKKYAAVEEELRGHLLRTEELRAKLLCLADQDAEAFGAVAACYKMPRATEKEKAARAEAMQSALREAAEVPLSIAAHCAELLDLTPPIAEKGNANVVSDAATAAHLAFAALHSALVNVNINLKFLKDEEYVTEGKGRVDALIVAAERSYVAARAACSQTLGITI